VAPLYVCLAPEIGHPGRCCWSPRRDSSSNDGTANYALWTQWLLPWRKLRAVKTTTKQPQTTTKATPNGALRTLNLKTPALQRRLLPTAPVPITVAPAPVAAAPAAATAATPPQPKAKAANPDARRL